jgi:hypothetical protein
MQVSGCLRHLFDLRRWSAHSGQILVGDGFVDKKDETRTDALAIFEFGTVASTPPALVATLGEFTQNLEVSLSLRRQQRCQMPGTAYSA